MPLIIEYTIPDDARDLLQQKLVDISNNGLNLPFIPETGDTTNQMNNELMGLALARIIVSSMPPEFLEKMKSLKQNAEPYGIWLKNLPQDPFIPPTPSQSSKAPPREKNTFVSEYLLRGMATILSQSLFEEDPRHYSIAFNQVIEGERFGNNIDPGLRWHKDGARTQQYSGNNRDLEPAAKFSLLYCLRGNPTAKTFFAHQDSGIKAFSDVDPERDASKSQIVSLSSGEMVVFNNYELLHGRARATVDPSNRRWVEGSIMYGARSGTYPKEEDCFIATAASILENKALAEQIQQASKLADSLKKPTNKR